MKTKTIILYNIDELKKENFKAFQSALENEKQSIINNRFEFALDDAYLFLSENYNLKNEIDNIYYSISYCQGDGACFTSSNFLSYTRITKKEDLNIFESWIIDNLNKKELDLLIEYLNCNYNLKIIKFSHHYEHAHTCKIDYEYFYSSDDNKYINEMNIFIDALCNKLYENVYLKICKELENYLYSFYDVNDDDALEYIKENDYFFNIYGGLESC